MKFTLKCLLAVVFFVVNGATSLVAQKRDSWDFGISTGYGKDFYHRKYHVSEKVPGGIEKFQSYYSLNTGIWSEKHFNASISIVTKLNFATQKLANSTLCECNVSATWFQDERHYWTSLGMGIRGYFPSKSSLKLFAETGFQGDWFLGYTESLNHQKHYYWNAAGYQQFVPGMNAGLGFQWKRMGLVAEYQTNIARTFRQEGEVRSGVTYGITKSILRQGLALKLVFRIL